MEADPLDVEMEFHMENQHEYDNINTIEASDETTWRDELAQSILKWQVLLLQHLTRPERGFKNQHLYLEGGDNGTFRHGYLMELEHYMNARHPNCGLKSLPHVDSKIRAWKKSYATVSLLKSRSGLGFQYSDGSILVDDKKDWDDLIKVDPNAKATGEFAEGPEDVVEEIERIEAQEITNDTSVGFPIDVVDVDDASGTRKDQAAQEEPNVSTGATQSPFTAQDEPNESTREA
ncbi:hypothetical protein KY285_020585 [Solanum tuberosum]|nr:hypothetical protein KY285_020585 [Solanum tuberosum]